MDKLQQARTIINEIDSQMAALFEKRMEAARLVAQHKQEHGLPIFDAARETQVIENNAKKINDEEIRSYYVNFLKSTMNLSRQYQHKLISGIKIAYSGVEGAVLPIENSYQIVVERGALQTANKWLELDRKVLIVTDSGVPKGYSQCIAQMCKTPFIQCIPQGEESKSFETYRSLLSFLLANGFTRSDCVVAVGGGVVGDLAGFVAASFMRGIDFYNVPTTLLSQIDSSIGGKVAINLDGIKNIVGAFYQPKKVLIDPQVLSTLPQRQISNGLAEAIKMALTSDAELFQLLETQDIAENLDQIILRCLQIKKSVVEQDEKESGLRKILNFGHTIGHGIESLNAQNGLYHGECVALGMIPMCSPAVRQRLIPVLEKVGLPTRIEVDVDSVISAMGHDKKFAGDTVTVVLVNTPGEFEMKKLTKDALSRLAKEVL